MAFNLRKYRGVSDGESMSIAGGPYQVELKSGKRIFAVRLSEIYKSYRQENVASVLDRRKKAFLDLEALFKSHRRVVK
jgi:hypothetical protein